MIRWTKTSVFYNNAQEFHFFNNILDEDSFKLIKWAALLERLMAFLSSSPNLWEGLAAIVVP